MRSVAIILVCVCAAITYGILHDQVTVRICVEYFTIGHPPVFGTNDPTLLGLGWGIIATWWVGLLLGVPLAIAARAGSRLKRGVGSLIRPIMILLAVMVACASVAGLVGWLLANNGVLHLFAPLAPQVPVDKHAPFIADACAHSASYFVGIVGGMVVLVQVWRSRKHLQSELRTE